MPDALTHLSSETHKLEVVRRPYFRQEDVFETVKTPRVGTVNFVPVPNRSYDVVLVPVFLILVYYRFVEKNHTDAPLLS